MKEQITYQEIVSGSSSEGGSDTKNEDDDIETNEEMEVVDEDVMIQKVHFFLFCGHFCKTFQFLRLLNFYVYLDMSIFTLLNIHLQKTKV